MKSTNYEVGPGTPAIGPLLLRVTEVKTFERYPHELLRKISEFPPTDPTAAFSFLWAVAEISNKANFQEGSGVGEDAAEAVVNAVSVWYSGGCPRFAEIPYFTLQNYSQAKLHHSTRGWWFENADGDEWFLPEPAQIANNPKQITLAVRAVGRMLFEFVPRKEE